MPKPVRVSVIITTYNWPSALLLILEALGQQSYRYFEVLIADDGSDDNTKIAIANSKNNYTFTIKHIWQPDDGFQAGKIRNKAVASAEGDYLIFLDGDCVPPSTFISRHVKLAEKQFFVAGNRILLNHAFTLQLLDKKEPIYSYNYWQWLKIKTAGLCNRFLPLIYLPFYPRKYRTKSWQGAKTCNLGLWKADFISVNGFDELYIGWGYEDSDLVCRLMASGIKRKEGRFALPVFHLWHQEQSRELQQKNLARFHHHLREHAPRANKGIDQYLSLQTSRSI